MSRFPFRTGVANASSNATPNAIITSPTSSSGASSGSYISSAPSSSMFGSFNVVAVPEKSLIWQNAIFCNLADSALLLPKGPSGLNYVQINERFVFLIKPVSAGLNPGEVSMSGPQRELCAVSVGGEGSSVRVRPWASGGDATALNVRMHLEVIQAKVKTEIAEEALVELLKEKYPHLPLNKGQTLIIDFYGKAIKLHILSIEVLVAADGKGDDVKETKELTRYSDVGVLDANTNVSITPMENRFLTFIKAAGASETLPLFKPEWKFEDMGIGGLDAEFGQIFRRAFASRLFPAPVVEKLGIKHVRGMLLWGPPGTGKTLIARQIGKMLAGREPKIVNGPEVLNKYVGQSEENIRNLFADAEKEQKEKGAASGLHIIIFDEIDAICKARGSDRTGTGVHDTVVNQILTKIDGVDSLNNILVIGMTNRKDLIDPALLRPGRLEVQVEISLADEPGRLQILKIHTKKMRENGFMGDDVDLDWLAKHTKNFSGAELEGLVKSATSFSLYGQVDVTKDKVDVKRDLKTIKVMMCHFKQALDEVIPAFGVAEDQLKNCIRGGLFDWGDDFARLLNTGRTLVRQVKDSDATPILSLLITGANGSGKTALAAQLALESGFPYVKLVTPDAYVDMSERGKALEISKVFEDAYKSPLSLIVIDDVERLLEYVPIGPRFSNAVLQTLLVLLKRVPPAHAEKSCRLMVVATTSNPRLLDDMQMAATFNVVQEMPRLSRPQHVRTIFQQLSVPCEAKDLDVIANSCTLPIGVKQLMLCIEMAKQQGEAGVVTAEKFLEALADTGLGGPAGLHGGIADDLDM